MHEYYCKKCHLLFENSIAQERCPTFKCQSRQIKDINTPFKLKFNPRDYGIECEEMHWNQGAESRKQISEWLDKELEYKTKGE